MKTRYTILSLAAAALMFAGCEKEITGSNEQNIDIPEGAFYASIEGAPEIGKTTIVRTPGETGTDGGSILWETDDRISINGTEFKAAPVESDKRHAIFTKVNGGDEAPTSPYKAYYPATIFDAGTITLPAVQRYNAAASLKNVMPMYSESFSNKMLAFKNICGLLEITLKGTEKIKSITVSDGGKAMSGVCTINEDGAAVITDHSTKTGVTLDCGEGVQLNNEAGVAFYIAIPAGEYSKLKIAVTTTDEAVWQKDASGSATILRNCIYTLNLTSVFDIQFIDLGLPSGTLWANMNLGATSISTEPTCYGDYYAWGKTEPFYEPATSNPWNYQFTWKSGHSSGYEPYSYGFPYENYNADDGLTQLKLEDDAANAVLGDVAHIPSKAQWEELFANCTYEYTYIYRGYSDVYGYITYTSKNNGKSIVFPAGGDVIETQLQNFGNYGLYYLCSDLEVVAAHGGANGPGMACDLTYDRSIGMHVRAVKPKPNALPGIFSVGPSKKVYFSKANLKYDAKASENKWKFYDCQYDYATTGYETNPISYFTWGYDAAKSIIPNGQASDNVDIVSGELSYEQDWGSMIGDNLIWRTLTTAEWQYLFNSRTDAASKVGFATVGGAKGIIILPDSFTDPEKNGGSGAFKPKSSTTWNANKYSTGGDWEAMESAGAVFLPAAGSRTSNTVTSAASNGYYWSSSSVSAEKAYSLTFNGTSVTPDKSTYNRNIGFSVRLVTDVK